MATPRATRGASDGDRRSPRNTAKTAKAPAPKAPPAKIAIAATPSDSAGRKRPPTAAIATPKRPPPIFQRSWTAIRTRTGSRSSGGKGSPTFHWSLASCFSSIRRDPPLVMGPAESATAMPIMIHTVMFTSYLRCVPCALSQYNQCTATKEEGQLIDRKRHRHRAFTSPGDRGCAFAYSQFGRPTVRARVSSATPVRMTAWLPRLLYCRRSGRRTPRSRWST